MERIKGAKGTKFHSFNLNQVSIFMYTEPALTSADALVTATHWSAILSMQCNFKCIRLLVSGISYQNVFYNVLCWNHSVKTRVFNLM